MGMRLLAACLVLAGLSVEARADVAGGPPPLPPRRVVLEGQAGVYAPLGQMGAALSVDALPWLSLSAGVGRAVNLNASDSPTYVPRTRLLFLPRARLWEWGSEWGGIAARGGLGLLYGESRADDHAGLRLYGELSIEYNTRGGFGLRLFGGGGRMLHEFRPEGADARNAPYAGYFGVGVGYAIVPNPAIEPGPGSLGDRWYGWQGLALGLASLSVYLMVPRERTNPPANPHALDELAEEVLPIAYVVTGPMVHYAHRRYARAAGSFALRLVLPAIGYQIGDTMLIGDSSSSTEASTGAIVGAVIAALIDAFALGWEPRPDTGR